MSAAPYPADTRAKGWRFELDYERIEQSSTWALAGPEGRPWLLMLWLTAWRQVPCGSFPNDEAVVAAMIGAPAKVWAKHRSILMRGWTAADDGRIYHETIGSRVLEMLEYRRKTAKRVADFKAAQREQRDANALPTGEQPGKNDTGTGTGTNTSPPSVKKERAPALAAPEGVAPEVWTDWLALRKAKKAPVTATVVQSATAEAALAGMSLEAFLRVWCARGSQGLQADWLKPHERLAQASNGHPAKTTYTRDKEADAARWMGSMARPKQDPNTFDMESADAARITFDA